MTCGLHTGTSHVLVEWGAVLSYGLGWGLRLLTAGVAEDGGHKHGRPIERHQLARGVPRACVR